MTLSDLALWAGVAFVLAAYAWSVSFLARGVTQSLRIIIRWPKRR